jgi:DNA modification methylase
MASQRSSETLPPKVKEQLKLFADDQQPSSIDTEDRLPACQSNRERLAVILAGDLNFHGQESGYASHDLHAFAAKFPPQLPRAFIRGLTRPGAVVLDPMMGSGTTLVEALLEGRKALGLDLDPLALRLTRVKTKRIDVDTLREAGYKVVSQAYEALKDSRGIREDLDLRFDKQTRAFVDYWFLEETQHELMALLGAIERVKTRSIRDFLELTFSSVIVTKSGGVSRARDLAHSRPHLDTVKVPKNALEQFSTRLRKNLSSIAQLQKREGSAQPLRSDARYMPLADNTVDLIVTSPPYANAIDYMRAHKFSLVWLGRSVTDLSRLRAVYIGAERVKDTLPHALPARPESIIQALAERDRNKAAVLRKYFCEMKAVIAEMFRVLRPDATGVIVVGTSVMRGLEVQTHTCLADIADQVGFDVVGVVERQLDRNKRLMPARFGKKSDSMIEQRMHEEYVIGLLKPSISNKSNRQRRPAGHALRHDRRATPAGHQRPSVRSDGLEHKRISAKMPGVPLSMPVHPGSSSRRGVPLSTTVTGRPFGV